MPIWFAKKEGWRKEERKEGRKEGRKERRKEGRKEGGKEGANLKENSLLSFEFSCI